MSSIDGRIKIGILDNDPIALKALSAILDSNPMFSIMWAGTSGRNVATLCIEDECWPDLLLVDMSLSGMDGLDFCRLIRRNNGSVPILAMTSFPLCHYEAKVYENGGQGIVGKQDINRMMCAINDLHQGRWMIIDGILFNSPQEAYLLLKDTKRENLLSEREEQVLKLASEGYSQKEIGKQLGIAPVSVRTHSRIAREKLGATTLSQAIVIWVSQKKAMR